MEAVSRSRKVAKKRVAGVVASLLTKEVPRPVQQEWPEGERRRQTPRAHETSFSYTGCFEVV